MYVEIGAYLRQAREAIGLTLDDVQEKTKIQKSFLIAIENGDFDKLPSPFYVRTYLRYYANCVRVEPHHILRAYRKAEQAIRYGIEPTSNSLQNTVRIPIINVNTGPQQPVGQTTGKHSTRRIDTQTALTIAKAPQTTEKVPQTTVTNPKLSSLAQESGQRFVTGSQQALGNTQKLPTISSKPGQTSQTTQATQTTQRMRAITQKLPTIARKLQNTDPGRSRSNLQNTGSYSLSHTGTFSAMAGQSEAAASAEQRAHTNPNLRLSNTNPRMQTNPGAGLEQSSPPQRAESSALSLENTFGKTSRLRRVDRLQNTNPPQPPAREPEADELQLTRSNRRGGTRKFGFSIPKNRLMPIAITVAVLFVFALGMIFLFGNGKADQKAQKPNTVVQTPVQANNSQEQQSTATPAPAEVKVEKVPGKDATYNIIGTNKVEIEVIPVNGNSVVMIYDAYQKGKVLDEVTVKAGEGSYKYSIELTDKQHHVYIKLGNPDAVKVKVNGFDIAKPKQQWIRIKLPQYN